MTRLLGLSVGRCALHAVVVDRGVVRWAAEAVCGGAPTIADAVARLASEAGLPVRRARIALERDAVQLRTVVPAPPLAPAALRRYVALEAPRLFRQNGDHLITDGVRVAVDGATSALWAVAASEALVQAALDGCAQAGLVAEAVGPAADILPLALATPAAVGELLLPDGDATEVLSVGAAGPWRSRRVAGVPSGPLAWAAPLEALGPEAPRFAAAFAATRARPRLALVPSGVTAARAQVARRRRLRLAALGVALWFLAGAVYASRWVAADAAAVRELAAHGLAVDTVLAVRRQLDAATGALGVMAAAGASRSRYLELLATLTVALGDSTFLVALRVEREGAVRLVGYAASAAAVLAGLEGVPQLRGATLEGPVTRENPPGQPALDRFAIVAHQRAAP